MSTTGNFHINKFQIFEAKKNDFTSGHKAPQDVRKIASSLGYEILNLNVIGGVSFSARVKRKLVRAFDWLKIHHKIPKNSLLLIQNPIRTRDYLKERVLRNLKKRRGLKVISMLHDIELLRLNKCTTSCKTYNYLSHEMEFTAEISDFIIVHNPAMKKYLVEQMNVNPQRIYVLQIFDYLCDEINAPRKFAKQIYIAANLASEKSLYLQQLKNYNIKFLLYGNGYDENLVGGKNIEYKGVFESEKLPLELDSGFGLVWDGLSSETCVGETGDYLRYNNPHKLSLYLSAGIPVFIWKHAAAAPFVEKNQIGILIEKISDIEDIFDIFTEEDYSILSKNAFAVSEKLRKGYFTKTALQQIENQIENTLGGYQLNDERKNSSSLHKFKIFLMNFRRLAFHFNFAGINPN